MHDPRDRSGATRGPRHAAPSARPHWLTRVRNISVIAFPLVLAWALLPANAKQLTAGMLEPSEARASRPRARPAEPPVELDAAAARIIELVNAERAKHDLPPLRVLSSLVAAAGEHSGRMADQGRTFHAGVDVPGVTGVRMNVECARTPEAAVQVLLKSSKGRANVLDRQLDAIGVATVTHGCLWATEVFARLGGEPPAGGAASSTTAPPTSTTTTTEPEPTTTAPPSTSPPASAPAPPVSAPSETAETLVKDLFARLNAERAARDLAPLTWDKTLATMAQEWSAEMASSGQFRHRDLGEAYERPGMSKFVGLGENIAYVGGYPNEGYQLHVGWMKSDGHRANMLQPGYDSVGIGVVCADGRAWATQNFGRLRDSSAPAMREGTPPQDPIVATELDGVSC